MALLVLINTCADVADYLNRYRLLMSRICRSSLRDNFFGSTLMWPHGKTIIYCVSARPNAYHPSVPFILVASFQLVGPALCTYCRMLYETYRNVRSKNRRGNWSFRQHFYGQLAWIVTGAMHRGSGGHVIVHVVAAGYFLFCKDFSVNNGFLRGSRLQ